MPRPFFFICLTSGAITRRRPKASALADIPSRCRKLGDLKTAFIPATG